MASGNYTGKYSDNFTVRTNWSSTSNATTNASSISCTHYLVLGSYGSLYISSRTNSCTVNGVSKNFSSSAISSSGGETIKLGTTSGYSVTHDSNGSKSVSASTVFNIQATIAGTSVSKITANGTLTLDNIARASTITCTDAYIESTATIVVSRKSTDYTHTITYEFGNATGTICEKSTDTTIGFTFPTSFYAQIKNDPSGTGKLYCKTYNSSGTQIGDTQTATFTATASEKLCMPVVNLSYKDSNPTTTALTGDVTKFIKYFSNAQCTLQATAMNSATIKSTKITCEDGKTSTSTSVTFNGVESATFYGGATDSREYSTSVTLSGTLIDYIKLTCNPTIYRPEPTTGEVYLKLSGNFFNKSFGSVTNTINCQYRYKESSSNTWGSWVSFTVIKKNDTYSYEGSLGTSFDYTKSYNFQVNVYDKLMNLTVDKSVSQGIPVFDWGKNDFKFNVPVNVDGNVKATNLPMATGFNEFNGFDDVGTDGKLFKSGLYSVNDNNLWYHLLNIRHRNGLTDGNLYGLQIRNRFTIGYPLEYRQQNNGTWTEWKSLNENNIMTIGLESNANYTVSTTWSYTKLPCDKLITKIGNKLTFENGTIKIGAGIKYIKVSANAMSSGIANYQIFNIALNGSYKATGYYRATATSYYGVTSLTPIILEVQENDVISLTYGTGATGTLTVAGGSCTYLTVEVIN